ncbi:hypothetical protein [Paenibacillus sp. FSL K6-1230]|uniref:hypothetical protein n=1 Tax=Paenibacillus sp. FSL K6-1230 TaxID=2921603 RepID=UPI0030FC5F43
MKDKPTAREDVIKENQTVYKCIEENYKMNCENCGYSVIQATACKDCGHIFALKLVTPEKVNPNK